MALHEYYCDHCRLKFEQITSVNDPDRGMCPQCKEKKTQKLISKFAVGGQGDLRESIGYGCPGCSSHGHGHGSGSSEDS